MSSHESDGIGHIGDSLSLDEESKRGQAPEKKRRVRACDMCRRRKVRCDGGNTPDKQCSNCRAFKYSCTYTQTSKKRFADPEYVQNLEAQLAQTQDLLQKLSSRLEVLDHQNNSKHRGRSATSGTQSPISDHSSPGPSSVRPSPHFSSMAASFDRNNDADDVESSDDEVALRQSIEQRMKQLSMAHHPPQFFGKSSGLSFLQTALDAKEAYVHGDSGSRGYDLLQLTGNRPKFWGEIKWLVEPSTPYPASAFPDLDLMHSLIDLYFENYNIYLPLLHRPTFEKNIQRGLHLVEEPFGTIALLTCALGAKFSDDPRTLLVSDDIYSAGWKWFRYVQQSRKAFRGDTVSVYDLQIFALVAEFMYSSPLAPCSFAVVGTGIRTAQDLGAHRRKVYASMPVDEGELLKRAFWVLVCLDKISSSGLGRSCCIQDEDFDVDYPRECDDEYWYDDEGKPLMQQPPGKPSLIAFFNCLIRLNQIHGCALRTIYAINKSKSLLGFTGPDWERHIVTELDSALNKWADTIPSHLKWDPHMKNITYLNQAAHLYTSYYYLQIVIHRPYLPSPRKRNPLPFPSLAICTNAARSCIHVLSVQYARGAASTWQNMIALFVSAVVLLLNVWTGKRAGGNPVSETELANIHKVMYMLKALESRWHTAGKFVDILSELAVAGDIPLPEPGPTWESGSTKTASSSSVPTPRSMPQDDENPTKRARLQKSPISSMSSFTKGMSPNPLPESFELNEGSLPMHSDELGRYPMHPAFAGQPQTVASFTMSANNWTPMATDPAVPPRAPADPSTFASGMNLDNIFSSRFSAAAGPYQTPENFFGYTPPPDQPSPTNDASQTSHLSPTSTDASWGALPNMFDSDAEMLWSSAPHSMEWEDWGRYILSVNGMGNAAETNSAQPHF